MLEHVQELSPHYVTILFNLIQVSPYLVRIILAITLFHEIIKYYPLLDSLFLVNYCHLALEHFIKIGHFLAHLLNVLHLLLTHL